MKYSLTIPLHVFNSHFTNIFYLLHPHFFEFMQKLNSVQTENCIESNLILLFTIPLHVFKSHFTNIFYLLHPNFFEFMQKLNSVQTENCIESNTVALGTAETPF